MGDGSLGGGSGGKDGQQQRETQGGTARGMRSWGRFTLAAGTKVSGFQRATTPVAQNRAPEAGSARCARKVENNPVSLHRLSRAAGSGARV